MDADALMKWKGHNNLEQLQKYLEVKPEQFRGAVAALSMISHSGESCDGSYISKWVYHDLDQKTYPYLPCGRLTVRFCRMRSALSPQQALAFPIWRTTGSNSDLKCDHFLTANNSG